MIERRLRRQLSDALTRYRRTLLAKRLAIGWLIMAAMAGLLIAANLNSGFYVRGAIAAFIALSVMFTLAIYYLTWPAASSTQRIAKRIEAQYPELETRLLTAIEQQPQLPGERYGYLQQNVIQEAVVHGYHHDWRNIVPTWRYGLTHLVCLFALAALVTSTVGLFRYIEPTEQDWLSVFVPNRSEPRTPTKLVEIEPGNAAIERGTGLLVLAHFSGGLPKDVSLIVTQSQSDDARQIPMNQSLHDPTFGGRVRAIDAPLDYRIVYDGRRSDLFHIDVFEYPALQQADANLDFPDYTGKESTLVQDVRHVTAVEGTEVTLLCQLNKPVTEATLQGADESPLALMADSAAPALYKITITLTRSRRLKLYLKDDLGRENKYPPEFILTAIPNLRPTVQMQFPSRDVEVSPLEELQLTARVSDDFGVARYGLRYQMGDGDEQELVLGTSGAPAEKITASHLLAFEDLEAKPDQLLSYYAFAEDIGPDGDTRQVMSDMFFAEVRPFDEIYRQGQQPPGGQEQNRQQQQGQGQQNGAGQAQQVAQQQKELINATWRIVRREDPDQLTPEFSDDVSLIRDTQASLIEQVQELAEKLNDPMAQQYVESVTQHMRNAVGELTRALDESALDTLSPALRAEQAAYQALLRLRAREHQVIQSNQANSQQSRQSGSSSSRSQQQLQQLQLDNNRNRYETERAAADRQQQAQSEERQILNRLKELAQRQSDLNERLKELQSELEKAETESEREELRKQLKRLREQQEEILRDTDELNSAMDEAQNRSSMSESRERLQQARENVRRSSEALQEGQVPRAISAGSRAEQELDELRDEFRERTSDRFAEEARDLQQRANKLVEAQKEISELLNDGPTPASEKPRSMRESSPREKLLEGLNQQGERLQDLMERMKQTVEEAEESQPLLAQELYDSYRRASQDRLPERLEETNSSLRRGFVMDARQLEESAREGLTQLRDDIEKATEGILAGETDALRRARDELSDLANQLNEEINQSDPREGQQPSERNSKQGNERRGDRQTENQQRQGNPSQGQEGQQSPSGERTPPDSARSRQGSQQSQNRNGQSPQEGQPNDQQSERPGSGQQPSEQQAEGATGQQSGQPRPGQDNQQDAQGQRPGGNGRPQDGDQQQAGNQRTGANPQEPTAEQTLRRSTGGGGSRQSPRLWGDDRPLGPLTGEGFRDWNDRLRDVEEMISDPDLKSDAARIRDRAQQVRKDLVRHSQEPNWELVRMSISNPLVELRDRISQELQKRESKKALVPIDRDPVPAPYTEQVRRYYERIGSGE